MRLLCNFSLSPHQRALRAPIRTHPAPLFFWLPYAVTPEWGELVLLSTRNVASIVEHKSKVRCSSLGRR